jgi:hypothetical protein
MNTQHLEILSAEQNVTRTFWTRIGTAFLTKEGKGYRLKLSYLPTSPDANVLLLPARAPETKQVG